MIRIFNILKAEYLVCILDAEDTEGIALQIYKTKIFWTYYVLTTYSEDLYDKILSCSYVVECINTVLYKLD